MRILAIETSGMAGSAAIAEGPTLVAEVTLTGQRRSTQTLAPAIHSLLGEAGWKPTDLQLIAVAIGPGSFTGLRLGVATAKMLAYATGAAVLGIDTLRTIAAQVEKPEREVVAVLDAGRGEMLVGHFRFDTDGLPRSTVETRLLRTADWLAELRDDARICGPGLRAVMEQLPADVTVEPETCWEPCAATIARLAFRDFELGRRDDLWTLAPVYYRRSAAEEVWERKQR